MTSTKVTLEYLEAGKPVMDEDNRCLKFIGRSSNFAECAICEYPDGVPARFELYQLRAAPPEPREIWVVTVDENDKLKLHIVESAYTGLYDGTIAKFREVIE